MEWVKQGLVFQPEGQHGFINSHAQVPTPVVLDDVIRVYFATRPERGKSVTTFLDLDKEDPTKVRYLHDRPVLEFGPPGAFDEHGIMPSWSVRFGDQVFLFYSGWQRSVSVPYNNYTGLAISNDGGVTFEKYAPGPVIDRTPWEIYSATSPGGIIDKNGIWHIYYCSGTHWHFLDEKYEHTYDLKYAWSKDGKTWEQTGETVIPQKDEFEAITRPTVFPFSDGSFGMWYCYRGAKDFRDGSESYRIGYAESSDLVNWSRKDESVGIAPSQEDWDSKMLAYPAIYATKRHVGMLYNGNGFGEEGFGLAIGSNE